MRSQDELQSLWADYLVVLNATMNNGGYTRPNGCNGRYVVGNGQLFKPMTIDQFNGPHGQLRIISALHHGHTFGTWLNDGMVYIDHVITFDGLKDALLFAYANGEKAIYNRQEGKEIFLPKITVSLVNGKKLANHALAELLVKGVKVV